ncbi:MAG: hypothetical protein H0W89_08105 [Candidatus Levybacteria bacterium]|nr:hypothetical protein [Candidatus Levybacteria bacterium]
MKKITIIFTVLLVLIGTGVLYFNQNTTTENANSQDNSNVSENADSFIVNPQTPTNSVTVESVTLSKDSYVVLREVVAGALGQVIEISTPLTVGVHKDIQIPLGSADINGKELIVMVYDDQSSDKIFNDFDQPTIDENGNMIGRYVRSGKPISTSIAEGDASGMVGHSMTGMASMVKVKYTGKSFTPEKIEVPVGSMVAFVNESSTDMWVASAPHPAHTDLPTFDQFKPTKKGSVYRYVFDKQGEWTFHDHINPNAGGIVTVK